MGEQLLGQTKQLGVVWWHENVEVMTKAGREGTVERGREVRRWVGNMGSEGQHQIIK